MTTITTDISIATEAMKPTETEVNDVLYALHELYLHHVVHINNY